MKKIDLSLALSLIAVAFLIGSLSGYFISPTYQQNMFQNEDMGLGNPDRFVDLRYINAMISHHRAAMLLASQAKNVSHREEIRTLASAILMDEPKLIAELYAMKKSWYNDGRRVQDPEVVNLGSVNETFDLRFLNALIAHHEEGIEMTQEIKLKSSRAEIIDNADSVENFLKNSLVTLKDWRQQWFN